MSTANQDGFVFRFDNSYEEKAEEFDFIKVWQISEYTLEPHREILEHVQFCHEITYVTAGSGVCTFNNRPFRVGEGAIFLSPEGSEHSISSSRYNPLCKVRRLRLKQ